MRHTAVARFCLPRSAICATWRLRRFLLACVVLFSLCGASTGWAAENWGVFPGARWGLTFPSAQDGSSGWLLEGHVDGLYIMPGDRFGLSLSLGYILQSIAPPDGARYGTGIELDGWTITPRVMYGIAKGVWLEGFGGIILGDLGSVGEMEPISTTGTRFGGAVAWDFIHVGSSDIAAHLEVMKTHAAADGMPTYDAMSVSLDLTFAFFADM
jgi:hypothetical protein